MRAQRGTECAETWFRPDRVRFVLVGTLAGGNVGASARALKNLGFARLELVRPRCDPRGEEARRMAVEAGDLLEGVVVHRELDAALAGAAAVIGLTRRRGKHRQPHWRLDAMAPELAGLTHAAELALLFGREDHGLSDQELDRCTHLVHLPADAEYGSFNLAQAVLLVAYELRLARLGAAPPAGAPTAEQAEREAMYRHLEQALTTVGFLREESREVIMRRFRRLFGRARLTAEEVQLLRGMARQILWVASRAGLSTAPRPGDEPG